MDELQSLRNPLREKWHARTSRSCDNRGNPPATCHGTLTAAFQGFSLCFRFLGVHEKGEGHCPYIPRLPGSLTLGLSFSAALSHTLSVFKIKQARIWFSTLCVHSDAFR